MSNLGGKFNRNLTTYEYGKCKNDTLVFVGDDCITEASNFLLKIKEEERKTINNKPCEYELKIDCLY